MNIHQKLMNLKAAAAAYEAAEQAVYEAQTPEALAAAKVACDEAEAAFRAADLAYDAA